MFILIICFLYTISAQSTSILPIYSRTYLRGLKKLENERIQAHYIDEGFMYIKNEVFASAKKGLVQYTTEPFNGCEPNEIKPYGFEKAVCENIFNGLYSMVSERFPDSQIIYDTATKRYTLKWD
jgi:hypothetical protein